jgi:glycosyltransferase involved in cell wall biosynthesis
MMLLVSVVVPTYRRPDLLRACLEALIRQDLDPSAFEVIVADDANDPQTRLLIETLALRVEVDEQVITPVLAGDNLAEAQPEIQSVWKTSGPEIRYVAVTGAHGPAAARNAGWRTANAEIIAFTDDDCLPASDWLRRGLEALQPGVDGVSGRVIVPVPAMPTDYEREQLGLERSEFITANCFYRKRCLVEAGGFDERFRLAWREDSDLYFSLLERGCRLVFTSRPVVVHPVRPVRWGVSLRQQKKAFYNALCYQKHPGAYAQKFKLRAPGLYYGMVAAAAVGLLGGLAGSGPLAGLSAAAYLGLGGGFTARRLRGVSRRPAHVAEMLLTSLIIPPLALYWRLRGALYFKVRYF